jgi:hypothetical protein
MNIYSISWNLPSPNIHLIFNRWWMKCMPSRLTNERLYFQCTLPLQQTYVSCYFYQYFCLKRGTIIGGGGRSLAVLTLNIFFIDTFVSLAIPSLQLRLTTSLFSNLDSTLKTNTQYKHRPMSCPSSYLFAHSSALSSCANSTSTMLCF